MRYIEITERIVTLAEKYRDELRERKGTSYQSPDTLLNKLHSDLVDETDKAYVKLIIDKWEDLIVLTPLEFNGIIGEFNAIIGTDAIKDRKSKTLVDGKEQEVTLYDEIVKAMRYGFVQSTIYPKYINKLGIKTCVYCNVQYAYSVSEDEGYLNYEIDHFLPKSKYPYLCTTFMNLQPSCPTCNKKKSNRDLPDDEELFQLFVEEGSVDDLSPVEFHMTEESLATYIATHNNEDIDMCFRDKNNPKLLKGMDDFFHINTLYKAHKDVVEELIWKKKIYNQVFMDAYKTLSEDMIFSDVQFRRFIIGNYDREEDIHKRPLAKLTQDIAKQLHIM